MDHSVSHSIAFIHRNNFMFLSRQLEAYNIGPGQFPFLMMLFHRDGMRQEDMGRLRGLTRASCTRALQKLETEGYVNRQKDPGDGRAYRVYLTEKGRRIQDVIYRLDSLRHETLLAGFSDTDKAVLEGLLERMVSNIRGERHEPS